MRAKHTALILTAGFLLIPTLSWSQFPGMGGGEGRASMRGNPDMLFNMLSGGKDVIYVDQMDPQSRSMFDRFGPMLGLVGNEITREQFSNAMNKVREMAAQGGFGGMNFRMGGGGGPTMLTVPGIGGGGMPAMPGGGEFGGNDRGIEEYFNKLDVNEDGLLEHHELVGDRVAESLNGEFDKYDNNHDNVIDLPEFKGYMKARRGDGRNPMGKDGGPDDETKKRPTVIRAGNLPRDFPYAMFDSDGDGQIGLYEWKSSGKRINEFLGMDLNNDGFLTVDEYYRWKKTDDEANGRSAGGMFARGGRGMGGPGMGMGAPGMGTGGANMFAMSNPAMGMNFGNGGGIPGMGGPGMGRGDFGRGGPGGPGGDSRGRGGEFGRGGEMGQAMGYNRFGGDQGGGQRGYGQFPGSGQYPGMNTQQPQGGYNRFGGGGQDRMGTGGGATPGFNPGAFNPGNRGTGAFTPPGGGGDRPRGPGSDSGGSGGDRPRGKGNFGSGGGGPPGGGTPPGGGGGDRPRGKGR